MTFRLILFIIIQLAALIFFIEMLRRVSKRVNEYDLEDNPKTLPFGFIRLKHIVVLYIFSYLIWVLFSFLLYFIFIDPHPIPFLEIGEGGMSDNFDLNL
jgi:hypothetical protein